MISKYFLKISRNEMFFRSSKYLRNCTFLENIGINWIIMFRQILIHNNHKFRMLWISNQLRFFEFVLPSCKITMPICLSRYRAFALKWLVKYVQKQRNLWPKPLFLLSGHLKHSLFHYISVWFDLGKTIGFFFTV